MRLTAIASSRRSGSVILAASMLAVLAGTASAQPFQRLVGFAESDERTESVRRTRDTGFVQAGYTDFLGTEDALVTKHKPSGEIEWTTIIPVPMTQRTYSSQQNSDESYTFAGRSNAFTPPFGLYLYKLDPSGGLLWNTVLFGDKVFFDSINPFRTVSTSLVNFRIQATAPENHAVVTSIQSLGGAVTGEYGQLAVVNPAGIPVFNRVYIDPRFENLTQVSFTDIRFDRVNSQFVIVGTTIEPQQDPTGTTGNPAGTAGGGGPITRILYVRTNTAGDVLLVRTYNTVDPQTQREIDCWGSGLTLAENGDVIIEGHTDQYSAGDPRHGVVLRIAAGGAPFWALSVRDFNPAHRAVEFGSDGELGVAGTLPFAVATAGPLALLSVAPGGVVTGQSVYGPSSAPDSGKALAPQTLPLRGWTLAGDKLSILGPGGQDVLLANTDDLGATPCLWQNTEPAWQPMPIRAGQIPLQPLDQSGYLQFGAQIPQVDPRNFSLCENICTCPGDANFDNVVNFDDITSVLGNFGAGMPGAIGVPGDADCNGVVNFDDITTVLGNFGSNCN